MSIDIQFPLNQDQIKKCIPHRDPFLLVDCVEEAVENQFCRGFRMINPADEIFKGHFPGNPLYPGVLMVEGLAQMAAILGFLSSGRDLNSNSKIDVVFTEIKNCRFRKVVNPGDKLDYHVKFVKNRSTFFWFEGEASVNQLVAASVSFSALMR